MMLSTLDLAVFGLILATTIGIVAWSRLSLKTEAEGAFELLLMGRSVTLPLFVASLVSSWYGGVTGVTALAYEKGLFNFLTQGVFWYVAYLVFALILIKKIPENGALTFPDLIGRHLGPRARRLAGFLNVLNLMPIACILNLGLLIKFMTGWSTFASSTVGLSVVFSYCLTGGLRSVVYADLIQFFAMVSAVALVVVFGVLRHGDPMALKTLLPANHLKLTGGEPLSTIFIWGFIAISTLADPLFYQRALAAKSRSQAIKGVLLATAIWFGFDCCTTLGGLYARAYFPHADPNESYFLFAFSVLPSGLKGLFLAGILSAALSSLDSNLFSASSIVSYDLQGRSTLGKRSLQATMLAVGVTSLLATLLFPARVASVWLVMGSISSACLLFPWLAMMLIPRLKNETRFITSIVCGLVAMGAGVLFGRAQLVTLDPFYFGLVGSALGLVFRL